MLDVRARRYRFRILNGSVSRYFSIGIVKQCAGEKACELPGPKGSKPVVQAHPFHMVANDGNLMEYAVPFDGTMDLDADGDKQDHNAVLPSQASPSATTSWWTSRRTASCRVTSCTS